MLSDQIVNLGVTYYQLPVGEGGKGEEREGRGKNRRRVFGGVWMKL